MAQEQKQPKRSSSQEDETTEAAPGGAGGAGSEAASARKEQLDGDVDSILDEIDDVLETNAEDFVRSFVQKGGE